MLKSSFNYPQHQHGKRVLRCKCGCCVKSLDYYLLFLRGFFFFFSSVLISGVFRAHFAVLIESYFAMALGYWCSVLCRSHHHQHKLVHRLRNVWLSHRMCYLQEVFLCCWEILQLQTEPTAALIKTTA